MYLGFHNTWRKPCLAERPSACQEGICSFELDICIGCVWALRLHLLFLPLITSPCVYKFANGLSESLTALFQPTRVCCSTCYQVTTLANNLQHLTPTSLTRYGWVVRPHSSYFGYIGFKFVHRPRILTGCFVGLPSPPGECRCTHLQFMSPFLPFQSSSANPRFNWI